MITSKVVAAACLPSFFSCGLPAILPEEEEREVRSKVRVSVTMVGTKSLDWISVHMRHDMRNLVAAATRMGPLPLFFFFFPFHYYC